jgi:fructoselysine and glucoselysine-specific PTS system IIA component
MRKFLIATHGTFSSGIKSSLDIIIGQTDNVFIIDAYVDGNKSIEDALSSVLKNVEAKDEFIVFSDLLGGSITNQVLRYALKENVHVVSGINLPLLIDVMLADSEIPVVEVIENAIKNAKDQMVYVNKLITAKQGGEQDD